MGLSATWEPHEYEKIYFEDVEEFKIDYNPNAGKKSIGFKQNS